MDNVVTAHHITANLSNNDVNATTDAVLHNVSVNLGSYTDSDLRMVTVNVCGLLSKLNVLTLLTSLTSMTLLEFVRRKWINLIR